MFHGLQDDDGERLLNIFRSYVISNNITNQDSLFQYYEVMNEDFFDTISNKFYNTPYLWWLIALFNNVNNPYETLEEGDILKILRYEYIYLIFDDIIQIGEM